MRSSPSTRRFRLRAADQLSQSGGTGISLDDRSDYPPPARLGRTVFLACEAELCLGPLVKLLFREIHVSLFAVPAFTDPTAGQRRDF